MEQPGDRGWYPLKGFCSSLLDLLIRPDPQMAEPSYLDMHVRVYKNSMPFCMEFTEGSEEDKGWQIVKFAKQTSVVQPKFRRLKYLLRGQKSDKGCVTEEGTCLVCQSQGWRRVHTRGDWKTWDFPAWHYREKAKLRLSGCGGSNHMFIHQLCKSELVPCLHSRMF